MAKKRQTTNEPAPPLADSAAHRVSVFKDLCQHLVAGYSADCFAALSATALRECFDKYPEEFDREVYDKALREGQRGWESIGRRQAEGSCIGNSRSWYYNMANRYGWSDRSKVETEHKGVVAVNIVSYATNRNADVAL